MLPVLQPAQLGRELAVCTILGAAVGVVRAFFPVRGRGAFVPDALLTGAVLFGVQSYAAALSSAGVLRWYMVLAAFAARTRRPRRTRWTTRAFPSFACGAYCGSTAPMRSLSA